MQMSCSRWWILPENMETDRFILPQRQGFEIEGIHMEDMDKVNEMLQPIIDNLQINQNETGTGYPASGTRNVCACIGNRVCSFWKL